MKAEWLLAVLFCLLCGCQRRADPLPGFPSLVLWAWERPEQLLYLNPRSAGVAFLARTIEWRTGQVTSTPRLQPLRIPPDTKLMAVVRLESRGLPLPKTAVVRGEILKAASLPNVQALQIDFDARASEQAWYASLLEQLRGALNPSVPLTITALASWCDRGEWVDRLPVNTAVPMLFRMGPGEPRETRTFRAARCRTSFGISTDELLTNLPHGRRLFVFHPRPWDEDSYRAVVRLAAKLR